MDALVDVISWLALLTGSGFVLTGTLGLLRLPEFFTRLHGAGVVDSLGLVLIIFGLMCQAGFSQVSLKLLLILGFVMLTSSAATHALAKAALHGGEKPVAKTHVQEAESSTS